MKILFITSYLPGRGLHGGSSRIFEIIRYLKEKGHHISLISFYHKEKGQDPEKKIKKYVDSLRIINKTPMLGKPYKEVLELIKRSSERENFDLVQFEYIHTGDYANAISPKIPRILTEHELHFYALKKRVSMEKSISGKMINFAKFLLVRKRELNVMKKMDKIICVNEMDAKELRNYIDPEKIEVIPHGVDVDFFAPIPHIKVEKNSIGFFGYYKHYPNVDAVIFFAKEILPLIRKEVPDVKFYIIGRNPPPEVKKLERIKGIVVTGYVQDLRPYIQKCEVIISPIRLGMGMRVKIMEAMSMGKPIVATDLSCEGFDVIDGRHVLIANEPHIFAECVLYLLENQAESQKIGENARALIVEKYNYRKIGEMIENLYHQVVEEKNID